MADGDEVAPTPVETRLTRIADSLDAIVNMLARGEAAIEVRQR